MAKTSLIMKQQRPPKFKSRAYTPLQALRPARAAISGSSSCAGSASASSRSRARCPGVIKASW